MTVQKHTRLDDDVVKLIEDWRRTQTPIPNFNQAINTMIKSPIIYTHLNLPKKDLETIIQALQERLKKCV